MHAATAAILQFFGSDHLSAPLQAVAQPIETLAKQLATDLPPGPEVTAGLRHLLEAKDCFVRAALPLTTQE